MFKSNHFAEGLLAFLTAHIVYFIAIILQFGFHTNYTSLFFVLIYLMVFLKLIVQKTGSYKPYILIYGSVIMLVLWQAIGQSELLINYNIKLLAIGIFIFTLSDSILAYNKFVKKFYYGQGLILSTYYLAQLLIVLSIGV